MKKIKVEKPLVLILAIIVCQLAGIVGSFFTAPSISSWYQYLVRPVFSPPNWIFAPVWTILYTLMGVAVYLVWLKGVKSKKVALALKVFGVHLVLNSLWSIIFFGAKMPGLAFLEIIILWILIVCSIYLFYGIKKAAAYLLIPYLLWVSFASVLNFSIWRLNRNVSDVYAHEFDYQKAYQDYTYKHDVYQTRLSEFNSKKENYLKNKTLSLKEEVRTSLFSLLTARNDLLKTYLTAIRMRLLESDAGQRQTAINQVQEEYSWYEENFNTFSSSDTLEDLVNKSKTEDSRFETDTTPAINFALATASLQDLIDLQTKHNNLYQDLKNEANSLVELKRADPSLFERWFLDIEGEFKILEEYINTISESVPAILSSEGYAQKKAISEAEDSFVPAKTSLGKINDYLNELENIVKEKR